MENLRRRVEELHAELERTESMDAASREAIEELLAEMQELLDRAEHEPTTLADRLREAGRHFEESHPTLTAAVGRVVDALAALGI